MKNGSTSVWCYFFFFFFFYFSFFLFFAHHNIYIQWTCLFFHFTFIVSKTVGVMPSKKTWSSYITHHISEHHLQEFAFKSMINKATNLVQSKMSFLNLLCSLPKKIIFFIIFLSQNFIFLFFLSLKFFILFLTFLLSKKFFFSRNIFSFSLSLSNDFSSFFSLSKQTFFYLFFFFSNKF